jgi:sugar lactone lactonase YvrE
MDGNTQAAYTIGKVSRSGVLPFRSPKASMPFPFSAHDCAARPSRPPSRRTSGLHALLAGLASAVLLAACGGSGSDQATATATPRLLASASAARAAVAADYTVLLQRVYLAYFGRPADPAGLAYYAAGFEQAGAPTTLAGLLAAYASNPTVKGAIDGFGSSAESQSLYPGNNAAFITAVYANLFNRAPDAAGRAYWAGLLDSGAMTRGSAALAIMNGAQAGAANARARALLARVTLATDLTAFQDDVGAAVGALAAPGIHVLAGSAVGAGNLDGIGAGASFGFESGSYVNALTGVATDSAGNCYVSDYHNHVIRKITPAGMVSTYAGDKGGYGHVDGPVAQARFANPTGLAIDANDNMYVGDDHEIRKITPAGIVTTFAGGDYRTSLIEQPAGLAVDGAGNVYVADSARHRVVKINVAGFISAIIGAGEAGSADGPAASAQFNAPQGISVDADGMVYVADAGNGTIRRIGSDGAVTTIAGQAGGWGDANGSAAQARFFRPIALAAAAGTLYVVDSYAYTVRKISGANGAAAVTSTFAMRRNEPGATSGNGVSAVLHGPTGIARDRAGVLFATSQWALSRIAADGATSTLAGVGWPPNLGSFNPSFDGVGAAARFGSLLLAGLIADGSGGAILSENASNTIRRVTATGAVTAHLTYASGNVYEQRGFSEVPGLARGADGTL